MSQFSIDGINNPYILGPVVVDGLVIFCTLALATLLALALACKTLFVRWTPPNGHRDNVSILCLSLALVFNIIQSSLQIVEYVLPFNANISFESLKTYYVVVPLFTLVLELLLAFLALRVLITVTGLTNRVRSLLYGVYGFLVVLSTIYYILDAWSNTSGSHYSGWYQAWLAENSLYLVLSVVYLVFGLLLMASFGRSSMAGAARMSALFYTAVGAMVARSVLDVIMQFIRLFHDGGYFSYLSGVSGDAGLRFAADSETTSSILYQIFILVSLGAFVMLTVSGQRARKYVSGEKHALNDLA